MNKKLKAILCLVLCFSLLASLAACKKRGSNESTGIGSGENATYTVTVMNQADVGLENVGVYIYEDTSLAELVWYDSTDENGQISFEQKQSDSYVAVLADVPTGYAVEEYYPLTGLDTQIKLAAGVMTGEEDITYVLGDMMMDFTVTDTEGNELSLLKLLEGKDAVILNFYYNACVPCQMEFPYLQEAYEEYADRIAVLAMNPVDDAEAVKKFREEMKLTFHMAACDPKWEKYMQLTAYPTTVIIDRFGNIVLIHRGSVDSAQTFKDMFAAVTGEEYKQQLFGSVEDMETTAEEGSVENPTFMGATPEFKLTIEGGKEHYIEFLKLKNLTLQIKDPDVYVIYEGKKYTPKNGVVSLIVTCPDMNTPVKIGFGNSSDQTKTFTVNMYSQPGTLDNPYSLVMGENQVNIKAGNEQGVYYIWTAPENGTLKAWCTSASAGVKYDCVLYNLNSYAQRSLEGEGNVDENGNKCVSVKVNKGDKVQMIAAVLPDESWNYRAGNFTYMVEFVPGEGRADNQVEMTAYSVKVTDDAGNPMVNVNFSTVVDGKATGFGSGEDGVAAVRLPTGEYKVTMIVPEGYTSDVTEFTLTPEQPDVTIALKTQVTVMKDYTVVVVDANGDPVADTTVMIGEKFAVTDANGKVAIALEQGNYPVKISAPDGYTVQENSYTIPWDSAYLSVALDFAAGTLNNPIALYGMEYSTDAISGNKSVYYDLLRVSGMILTIENPNAKITIGEKTYTPDESGKLSFTVPNSGGTMMPVTMQLSNSSEQKQIFNIVMSYPVGHAMNPKPLESLGALDTTLEEGDEDGQFYSWTAPEEGVITFYVTAATEDLHYDLVLVNTTNGTARSLKEDGSGGLVTLNVAAGDQVTIQVTSVPFDESDNHVGYQPGQILSAGGFTAQENTEDAKLTYSVAVKDTQGNPLLGVSVTIGNKVLTTDENGLAYAQLVEGTYTAKVDAPKGYKAQIAQFSLTTEEPQATAILEQIVLVNYQVDLKLNGAAYTGSVKVQLLQDTTVVYEETVTSGSVTAELEEGSYTVKLIIADGALSYNSAVVTASAPAVTIDLITYTDYKVTVTDMIGNVQTGIQVQILNGEQMVADGQTDANGQFAANLETGNYTVELSFGDNAYYYNKDTAVLSGNAAALTIRLASEPDSSNRVKLDVLNQARTYVLSEGGTHVTLSTGKTYYSEDEKSYFFVFEPTRSGVYRISLDHPDVPLRDWGTVSYQFSSTLASSNEDNALHKEIFDGQIGHVQFVIGIEAVEGVTDLAILITREGDSGFNIEEVPWDESWKSGYVPTPVTLASGSFQYVDIKAATSQYTIVYNSSDGYYHVGSVDGPVLYINLGTVTKQNVSLDEMINGAGQMGGAALRRFFYDENGKFVKKEDYTDLMNQYIACADPATGLYPVTADMAYMVQNGGMTWWDSTHPNYILEDCNPELGWLFACGYFS